MSGGQGLQAVRNRLVSLYRADVLYWLMKSVLLGPILRLVYRPWVEGVENVPKEGAAILAGNHLTVVDSFFLPVMIERKVSFLAKSDYFTEKGIKGWFKRRFVGGTGQVPVDRSGGRASEAALNAALKVLDEGADRKSVV